MRMVRQALRLDPQQASKPTPGMYPPAEISQQREDELIAEAENAVMRENLRLRMELRGLRDMDTGILQ